MVELRGQTLAAAASWHARCRLFCARHRWTIGLLLIGAILRLALLGEIPGGLNQDEAAIGYDAWALYDSGIDRNGVSWPIHFISWGSGQNALYAYLSIPFIALGGLSVFTTRIAMALCGVASLYLFWHLGRRAEDESGPGMAVWALLLLVFSPWHIMASRWALESNLAPAVALLATVLFASAKSAGWPRLLLAAAALTLSVYAYGTAYLFAPLFLCGALIVLYRHAAVGPRGVLLAMAAAFIVALPAMMFILNNAYGDGHLHIGPIGIPRYPTEARYDSIFLPLAQDGWSRVPDNMARVFGLLFGGQDDGLPWNAIPGWGPQFVLLTPFAMWGVLHPVQQRGALVDHLMLVWLICALLVACLTDANINRVNLVWLPTLWFAARGLWMLRDLRWFSRVAGTAICLTGAVFAANYFFAWQSRIGEDFFAGFTTAIETTLRDAPSGERVFVTEESNMPYISVAFVDRTPPRDFVATAKIENPGDPFQYISAFDRFLIGLNGRPRDAGRYWVAHRSQLGSFDDPRFRIRSFGRYASVVRQDEAEFERCAVVMSPEAMSGSQAGDVEEPVGAGDAGLTVAEQRFSTGFAVGGDSAWRLPAVHTALLRFDVGMAVPDDAACEYGTRFIVEADGKVVHRSDPVLPGAVSFVSLALEGARELRVITDAAVRGQCSQAYWLRPVVWHCQP